MSSNCVTSQSQRKPWTTREDKLLKELKKNKDLDWVEVARRIGGRNPSQCSQRWKRIKGFKLRRTWTEQEDQQILEMMKIHGQNWTLISTFFVQRTGKQIRERYLNQLNPDINTEPWTEEEDLKIVDQYKAIGGKWSIIVRQLNRRSENSVKNRFYSCLRHKYLNIKNPYYIVPEKKQKLNEDESQQNQVPLQLSNYKTEEIQNAECQSLPQSQQQPQLPIYQTCIYQYPVFVPQPMFMPVYYYPQQYHNFSNGQ